MTRRRLAILGAALVLSGLVWRPIVALVVGALMVASVLIGVFIAAVEEVNAQREGVIPGRFYRPGVTPVDRAAMADTWAQWGRR